MDAADRAAPDERKDLLEMAEAWLALAHGKDATGTKNASFGHRPLFWPKADIGR